MKQYERYIKNVKSGGELVCELTRLAVDRHLSDLEKKDWDFYFDEGEADKATGFFKVLRHTSGELGGTNFNLQDSQAFIISMIFGWRRKSTGGRRFTQVYLETARKSGKSELAAGVEIYCGFFEGVKGAQVYSAATTRDQAGVVFAAAKSMCNSLRGDSKAFAGSVKVFANSINHNPTESFIQKVSSDADTLDGLKPHCVAIDEYHAHKTDDVKGVMQTGMATGRGLLFIITTAGFEKENPCYRVERANAVNILKGIKRQENLFTVIFAQEDDEGEKIMSLDVDDPKQAAEILRLAKKSNPNLGSTPTNEYLLEQVRDAQNKGSSTRVQVLTKNFNIWLDAPKVWIPEEDVKAVMRPIDISEFYGREVFLGLDLAATTDLTALAIFAPGDEILPTICKVLYWLPEDTVNKRNDIAPYREWSEGRHIHLTSGNIVDYGAVLKTILHLQETCNIHSVGHDQWNAWDMNAKLSNDYGIVMTPVLPRYTYLSNPTKELEKMVISGAVQLDENPVLLWNFRNIALQMRDDNVMPSKDKSAEKIDGIAAIVDALYVWLQTISQPTGGSYLFDETSELITV